MFIGVLCIVTGVLCSIYCVQVYSAGFHFQRGGEVHGCLVSPHIMYLVMYCVLCICVLSTVYCVQVYSVLCTVYRCTLYGVYVYSVLCIVYRCTLLSSQLI